MRPGLACVVVVSMWASGCCCSLPTPRSRAPVAPHPAPRAADGGAIPTEAERIAVLRELFALLPLREPRPLYLENGSVGPSVVPWVQYYVSEGNCDESGRIARVLGMPEGDVFTQLDDAIDHDGRGGLLLTEKVLAGLPGDRRVFTEEQFYEHHGHYTAVWWTLTLPVLTPTHDVALVSAQLGGTSDAEDFWWLAKKQAGAWSLTPLVVKP